jgi:hypothetical protein
LGRVGSVGSHQVTDPKDDQQKDKKKYLFHDPSRFEIREDIIREKGSDLKIQKKQN